MKNDDQTSNYIYSDVQNIANDNQKIYDKVVVNKSAKPSGTKNTGLTIFRSSAIDNTLNQIYGDQNSILSLKIAKNTEELIYSDINKNDEDLNGIIILK